MLFLRINLSPGEFSCVFTLSTEGLKIESKKSTPLILYRIQYKILYTVYRRWETDEGSFRNRSEVLVNRCVGLSFAVAKVLLSLRISQAPMD